MENAFSCKEFKLASDDAYEGRCCEVFFTRKRQLIFHCSLCENKYCSFVNFFEHMIRQHANDWAQITTPANDDEQEEATIKDKAQVEQPVHTTTNALKEELHECFLVEVIDDECSEELATEYQEIAAEQATKDQKIKPLESIQETLEIIPLNETKMLLIPHDSVTTISQDISHDVTILSSPSRKRKRRAPAAAAADERRHKCEHCGFAFKQLFNLRAHLRRHTEPKPFDCEQCSKQFCTRSELMTHARRHTGEKPFACTHCDAAFVSSGALSEHNKRHINYRPHTCPHCPKSFYDTFQLSEHVVAHTLQRNHVCELCRATFQRHKSLVAHMKLHANAREYVCDLCPAAFNQRQALTNHFKQKHKILKAASAAATLVEGITTICLRCQLEFADVSKLLAHEKQIHPNDDEFILSDEVVEELNSESDGSKD